MCISCNEPSSVILHQNKVVSKMENMDPKVPKQGEAKGVLSGTIATSSVFIIQLKHLIWFNRDLKAILQL